MGFFFFFSGFHSASTKPSQAKTRLAASFAEGLTSPCCLSLSPFPFFFSFFFSFFTFFVLSCCVRTLRGSAVSQFSPVFRPCVRSTRPLSSRVATEAVLKRAPQACEKKGKQTSKKRKKRQDSPAKQPSFVFFFSEAKRSTRTAVRLVFRVPASFLFFRSFFLSLLPWSQLASVKKLRKLFFRLLYSVQP